MRCWKFQYDSTIQSGTHNVKSNMVLHIISFRIISIHPNASFSRLHHPIFPLYTQDISENMEMLLMYSFDDVKFLCSSSTFLSIGPQHMYTHIKAAEIEKSHILENKRDRLDFDLSSNAKGKRWKLWNSHLSIGSIICSLSIERTQSCTIAVVESCGAEEKLLKVERDEMLFNAYASASHV